MLKVFYNKKTLDIVGMSETDTIGNFPFVELDTKGERYHTTEQFKIEKKGKKVTIKVIELKHE